MGKELKDKQKMFCDEYLLDLNATQAAIRAGYSKTTAPNASRWLDKNDTKNYKPKMAAYIEERLREKEEALIAKQDEVLRYISAVLRGLTQSEEIVVVGTGDGCSEAQLMQKAPSEKERLKAAELLGKYYALFTEKVEQDVDMNLNITVDYGDGE